MSRILYKMSFQKLCVNTLIVCNFNLYFVASMAGKSQNMKPVQIAQVLYFVHILELYTFLTLTLIQMFLIFTV